MNESVSEILARRKQLARATEKMRQIADVLGVESLPCLPLDKARGLGTAFRRQIAGIDDLFDRHVFWRVEADPVGGHGYGAFQRVTPTSVRTGDMLLQLRQLGIEAGALEVLVLHEFTHLTGGPVLDASIALHQARRLWRVLNFDFCLIGLSEEAGLYLEQNRYGEWGDQKGVDLYSAGGWGVLDPLLLTPGS